MSLVLRIAERYARETPSIYRLMTDAPARADKAMAEAYLALQGFKADFDAMHEIPSQYMPFYRQAMKAADKVTAAQQETHQLRMMIQRGFPR